MANATADGAAPPWDSEGTRGRHKPGGGRGGGGTTRKEGLKSPEQDTMERGKVTEGRSIGRATSYQRQTLVERHAAAQKANKPEQRREMVRVKEEVIEDKMTISEWLGMTGATAQEAIVVQEETERTPKRKQMAMKEGSEARVSPVEKRKNAESRELQFDQYVVVDDNQDDENTEGMETDPIEIEERDEDHDKTTDAQGTTNEETGPTPQTTIPNPYGKKKKHEDDEDPTPTKGNRTSNTDANTVTWAKRAESPQAKLVTHERIKEAHDSFFEVGFHVSKMGNYTPMEEVISQLRDVIRAILIRAKEIDRKSKINPWSDDCELPTIAKYEDIPFNPRHLKAYLNPTRVGLGLKAGNNNGWRVRITTRISRNEFLHHWGLSKRDFTKVRYITLREAPLQHSTYHAAGYFLNSSDGQIVEELERGLSEELSFKVGINYRPAALDRRAADELWGKAKKHKMQAPEYMQNKTFFKHAPFAQQVYAPTRAQAHQAAQKLSQMYGSSGEDGQYPRLPDGTRMRFIAASVYLDMQGRATATNLFPQQVKFQTMEVAAAIPVKDPYQKFPTQQDRTMQQLLMDLKDPDMGDEPYFRHLRKKFHWNYKVHEYEVSIHGQMYQRSAKILRDLKSVMTKQYGPEVGEAIADNDVDEGTVDHSRGGMSGITIATEDRYLNGPAKFIIEGLENVQIDKEKSLTEIRKKDDDENTMNIKSTTSGRTGDTGNTVPDYDAHTTITTMDTYRGNPKEAYYDEGSLNDGTNSTTTNTNTDDQSGSKRNNPNGGWIVKGGAAAAKALAQHVAAALDPRQSDGEPSP